MAETADDLSTPLGQKTARAEAPVPAAALPAMQALAVLLGLFLVAFAGFAIFNDNPLGGEPIAHIALRPADAGGRREACAGASRHCRARARNPRPRKRRRASKRPSPSSTARAARAHDVVISGDGAGQGRQPMPRRP